MTGLILVVDDVPANVKLLEAKLTNEYYDVITARDGYEAIEKTREHKPDLVLLDVMMPGIDGFETCRTIKKDPDISHIPIVMVTALSDKSDRLQGLEAGADDFITKPINDTALFARVRNLIRIKVLIDELRLRDQSGAQMGIINDLVSGDLDVSDAKVVIIDDDQVQSRRAAESLQTEYQVFTFADHEEATAFMKANDVDMAMISTAMADVDGLRLATQFKAVDSLRHVPTMMLVDEDDMALMLKALDLGVNDYLVTPLDTNEMLARVKTQLRRKRFQDALKSNYKESVSMAITDSLTKLYNRHYLDTHLVNLFEVSQQNHKNMSLAMMDMDHFKSVNDTYGHDVGDEILVQLSKVIVHSTRSADLVARYGGEEFVVLMPETDFEAAYDVAERIRHTVEKTIFNVSHEVGTIQKTISVGIATLNHQADSPERLLKRADTALYASKEGGRNKVSPDSNPTMEQAPAQPLVSAPPVEMPPPKERSLDMHTAEPEAGRMLNTNLNQLTPSVVAPSPVTPSPVTPSPAAPSAPLTPAQPPVNTTPQPSQEAGSSAENREPVIYELARPAPKPTQQKSDIDDEPQGTF